MRIAFVLLTLMLAPAAGAQDLPTVEAKTEGLEKQDGLFPVYWDADAGIIWLEVPALDQDFLYQVSLPAGLGSNDVGLDRGQLGDTRVVRFERVGPKLLLVQPNLRFRATTDNVAERRAVTDAFAPSIVWAFDVAAVTADGDGTRLLVDATDFVVRDAHGVAGRLQATGQGSFRLDERRSVPYPEVLRAFPQNTELEARLTFTSDSPGSYVRSVAADPEAVTLRVRHSLIELPDPGYEPRPFDPRSGFFGISYADYAAPIGEELTRRYVVRHRLEKVDPTAATSPAREPIVYYLDPGTPEPVRSALLDGARWWGAAFEAIGFEDAFRVEMLPDDADPLDVRYNMIQWVHRSTRGWSYGSSVVDPRTGEILKGHVSLGSLRVRQDYLLAEGLLAPYGDGLEDGWEDPDDDPMLQMALARLRQLSAHEVGHTLGLAHNFAASANDRASVMDYPAPLATVVADDSVSLADAYAVGLGRWDVMAVAYGYGDVPPGIDEAEALGAILEEMERRGLYYVTDRDARPAGGAHPLGHLWDNGDDAVTALGREMAVREVALADFGLRTIRAGRPLATMEEVLVPLYLRHRYQVEATAKLVGGVLYSYAVRGDARPIPEFVPREAQLAAFDALLGTVQTDALALPQTIRHTLPPRPPGYAPTRELFNGYTGLTFDPYAPAEVAASMVFDLLIHPERAARLVYQADADPRLPDLITILERTSNWVWDRRVGNDPYQAELGRVVQLAWTDALLDVATREELAPGVRAALAKHIRDLHAWLQENPGNRRDEETQAFRLMVFDLLDRYLFREYRPDEQFAEPATPPGSPIGATFSPTASDVQRRVERRRALLDAWAPALETACGHEGW